MANTSCISILCVAFTLGSSTWAGELEGTVRLDSRLDAASSPAVVYIASKQSGTTPSPGSVTVDQRNLQFVPRVQAMALGGSIVFRNSDREAHNVNLNSPNGCCAVFNQMVGPSLESDPVQPSRPGLVRVLCNIHQQMRGFVMVCPSSMFAVTDAQGRFRIQGVPDGPHRLVIWQESSKPFAQDVFVSGQASVDLTLEASGGTTAPSNSLSVQSIETWAEVLKRISSTLEAAARIAQRPEGGREAERLARDAYYEHFEASELETAVRRFLGEGRVFDVEQMFRLLPKSMRDLAAGQTGIESVRAQISDVVKLIDKDIRELNSQGIRDRTALTTSKPNASLTNHLQKGRIDFRQVLEELRQGINRVERLVASGDRAAAEAALSDVYFDDFHQIEPALAAHNFAQMRKVEGTFQDLRGRILAGIDSESVHAVLGSLLAEIEIAAASAERAQQTGFASAFTGFSNAFVILTREGVEALLIVTALLIYLNRMGRPDDKRAIYAGLLAAVFATLLTWFALQWLIAKSGVAQEMIEGTAALAAAAVLFYVSYWLISKSEARRWQEFLTRQVGHGVSVGGKWAIAVAAFLAVYREGAETILMFQPLLVHSSPSKTAGVVAGVALAIVVLLAVFWGLRFASFRLTIRPFFRVTGALLFVLAIVFAGKGVTELQEAGFLTISPIPDSLYKTIMTVPHGVRDALGLAPTVQSLVIQGTLTAGAAVSLAAVWLIGRIAPAHKASSPVKPAIG